MSYLDELDLEEEGLTKEEIKKRKTKIFVGGLKYSSKDDVLKEYFSQFGEIEEAVVIYDRESGLSKGYGFVTMSTDEGAELAIKDKSPRLDGRRCNVNLAYIGQKKKCSSIMGKGKSAALAIQGAQIFQTSPSYLQNSYQQKIVTNGQAYYSPTSTQLRYPVYGQIGVPYMNQCQYYAVPGSSPTYDQRDGTYMQPYILTQQFVVAGNNTNGYTSPTAVNNNNNNNSSVPNYNHVAFIGQYPVLMETSGNPVGQMTTTTPTYASSPGPTTCAANGNAQMFHFQQQEIVNQ